MSILKVFRSLMSSTTREASCNGDLINKTLQFEKVGDNLFKFKRTFILNTKTIYGGELMAQSLTAAKETVPKNYAPCNISCFFLGSSDVNKPNLYKITDIRNSSSFCYRSVKVYPFTDKSIENAIPYFRMECSFKLIEDDLARFTPEMPEFIAPKLLPDFKDYYASLNKAQLNRYSIARLERFQNYLTHFPFEVKCINLDSLLDSSSSELHVWARINRTSSDTLGTYRDAMIAYISDPLLIFSTTYKPIPWSVLCTINQSAWFHNPNTILLQTDWLLFSIKTKHIGNALTLSYGTVWDQEKHLLASLMQQGLKRSTETALHS